jgi:limonene-1,2-epoxide hydrolase
MSEQVDVVRQYFEMMNAAIAERDPATIESRRRLLADDIVYQNKPLRRIEGKPELLRWQSEFAGCDFMRGEIRHVAQDGDWVLTERVEEWSIRGIRVGGEIMGIFEVRDGQIHTWFDHMSHIEDWRASGQMPDGFFDRWSGPE